MVAPRLELVPYALAHARPVHTSRVSTGRRQGWLLGLDDGQGRRGWGDVAPWPGFGGGRDAAQAALRQLEQDELPPLPASVAAVATWGPLAEVRAHSPEVGCGLEQALLDLLAQAQGLPLARLVNPSALERVRTHTLVGDADEARSAARAGYRTLKLKVGAGSLERDVRRLAEIRDAVGPGLGLRLDANGAYGRVAALAAADAFAPHEPEWLEQPLPAHDLEGLAWLRRQTPLPLAVDEGVTSVETLSRVISLGAAEVVVLKPMFLGGVGPTLELARQAAQAGLEVIVTHALESVVGRSGALHAAAAAGLTRACGLGGALDPDFAPGPQREGDALLLPSSAGLGLGQLSLLPVEVPR